MPNGIREEFIFNFIDLTKGKKNCYKNYFSNESKTFKVLTFSLIHFWMF